MENKRFNIRVYGFLIDERKILVSDEFRLGMFMTKFPGAGLIYGEGLTEEEFTFSIDKFIVNKLKADF